MPLVCTTLVYVYMYTLLSDSLCPQLREMLRSICVTLCGSLWLSNHVREPMAVLQDLVKVSSYSSLSSPLSNAGEIIYSYSISLSLPTPNYVFIYSKLSHIFFNNPYSIIIGLPLLRFLSNLISPIFLTISLFLLST